MGLGAAFAWRTLASSPQGTLLTTALDEDQKQRLALRSHVLRESDRAAHVAIGQVEMTGAFARVLAAILASRIASSAGSCGRSSSSSIT